MYVNGKDAVFIPSEARPIFFGLNLASKISLLLFILNPDKRSRSPQKCLTR